MRFIFGVIAFLLIGHSYAQVAICENTLGDLGLVGEVSAARFKRLETKILKSASEVDPSLAKELRELLEAASVTDGLRQVAEELKRRELLFFKAPHRVELQTHLSKEQIRYLQENPKHSSFDLKQKSPQELTFFYANSLKQLMIAADKMWREELSDQMIQDALSREASEAERKMMGTQLRVFNHSLGKPEVMTEIGAVERYYSQYRVFNSSQTKAVLEAYQIFLESPKSEKVTEILDNAGFSWNERNRIVAAWEMPKWEEWRCCRAGCSDCPINHGF